MKGVNNEPPVEFDPGPALNQKIFYIFYFLKKSRVKRNSLKD